MYAILVGLVGIVAFAAGVGTIVFLGIPVKEFSLGNTYILAGTTVLAAGLVLIGLAFPLWYLQRIADALAPARGRARLSSDAPAVAAGRTPAPPPRVPFPPRPPEGPGRAPEPRVAAPSVDVSKDMLGERPRPKIPPTGPAGEPPVVEESDEVTLSPRAPARPVPFPPRTPSDMPLEPKLAPGEFPARAPGSASTETLPPVERPWPPGPAPGRPAPGALLDSFWPARQDKPPAGASEARQNPQPGSGSANETAREDKKTEAAPSQAAGGERRAVSILKSGVVDGMAYTLYTDGSIEAELPEGTVRFGSIGELREHLEKHPG